MTPAMKYCRQRGIAIVSAIFILLVLAGLGAFAVNLSTSSHMGSAQDLQSARALQAARAGIEYGLFRLKIASAAATDCSAGGTSVNVSFPASATTLNGMTATVTCVSSGGIYRITSTACNQPTGGVCPNTTDPGATYVERQLEVLLQ